MVVRANSSPVASDRRNPENDGDLARDAEHWTDFDSSSFKGNIKQHRTKRASVDVSRKDKTIRSDQSSVTPTWMNIPINSDASWIPIPPPAFSSMDQGVNCEGLKTRDDAPRDGPGTTAQSPTERRRTTTRLHSNLHDESTRTNHDSGTKMPDAPYVLRSPLPHGTPVRRGRTSSRVTSETRSGSTSRATPAYRDASPVNRQRSISKSSRGHPKNNSVAHDDHPSNPAKAIAPPRSTHHYKSGCSSSVGPGLPRPANTTRSVRKPSDEGSIKTTASANTLDVNIGRHVSFGSPADCVMSPKVGRRGGGIIDRLFGSQGDTEAKKMFRRQSILTAGSESSFRLPDRIHTRILLSATVYHNTASNLWITTINTNQRGVNTNPATASKFLKAYSFSSEKEARESAIANAPPKMLPINQNPNCFICNCKFAVFRRPCHCRNCGVCVCSGCITSWPSRMIPEMYNLRNENSVNICYSCEWLSDAFKAALMKGEYQSVIALYGTGNVNLRTPFPAGKHDKKGETMHPIHCAVEGGNLDILRWLLEKRFCPVKRIASGNGKQKRGQDIPIVTSKGRSVLSIAMSNLQVEIIGYLVVDRNVSVYEMKDLTLCLRVLETALISIPRQIVPLRTRDIVARWAGAGYEDEEASDISGSNVDGTNQNDDSTRGESRLAELTDTCIICYANPIDCVITPCGHQICCLTCGENMRSCPICNTECGFIHIFKP